MLRGFIFFAALFNAALAQVQSGQPFTITTTQFGRVVAGANNTLFIATAGSTAGSAAVFTGDAAVFASANVSALGAGGVMKMNNGLVYANSQGTVKYTAPDTNTTETGAVATGWQAYIPGSNTQVLAFDFRGFSACPTGGPDASLLILEVYANRTDQNTICQAPALVISAA